jgi:hypothetical protein
VTACLAPPRSQRPGQGPLSPHPKAGPGHTWIAEMCIIINKHLKYTSFKLSCCKNFKFTWKVGHPWRRQNCSLDFSCDLTLTELNIASSVHGSFPESVYNIKLLETGCQARISASYIRPDQPDVTRQEVSDIRVHHSLLNTKIFQTIWTTVHISCTLLHVTSRCPKLRDFKLQIFSLLKFTRQIKPYKRLRMYGISNF